MNWLQLANGMDFPLSWHGMIHFGRYYLCSVHNRSLKSLCEKMKYLHSVVFPYGLCQPGNYTVAANSTVLLSSWSKWWVEFVFYDYTLYSAPGGHIDWRRKTDLIDFRSLTSDCCQNSIAHLKFNRQSSQLMAVILSKNQSWDFRLNHTDFIWVIFPIISYFIYLFFVPNSAMLCEYTVQYCSLGYILIWSVTVKRCRILCFFFEYIIDLNSASCVCTLVDKQMMCMAALNKTKVTVKNVNVHEESLSWDLVTTPVGWNICVGTCLLCEPLWVGGRQAYTHPHALTLTYKL